MFGKDVHETASEIFNDGIMTLITSIIMANNNISEEELERKVEEKFQHLDNIAGVVKEKVKSLEDLGIIERKGDVIVLTKFGVKVGKVLKDMLKTYYETFNFSKIEKALILASKYSFNFSQRSFSVPLAFRQLLFRI